VRVAFARATRIVRVVFRVYISYIVYVVFRVYISYIVYVVFRVYTSYIVYWNSYALGLTV